MNFFEFENCPKYIANARKVAKTGQSYKNYVTIKSDSAKIINK